jgi:hypothetical protein
MPELVDGDVVALVVHAVGADARAQMRLVPAALRAPGVTGAARRIDLDVRRQVARALLAESKFYQDGGNVRSERASRRIFLLGDRVEFCLSVLPALQEAVVPDVEWLERTLETALDKLRNARHERRADDLL